MNYRNQLAYVQSLSLPDSDHRRVDCPSCKGVKTLSISRLNGMLLWHCYKASCNVSGKQSTGYTLDDIRQRLRKETCEHPVFTLPEHFTSVLHNDKAMDYLRKNNCLLAYGNGLADIRYDPRLDRVVFVSRFHHQIVGATGRILNAGIRPKWLRYDKNQYPFIVGTRPIALIVEDAASACAVSHLATGIAILGTNFHNAYLSFLKGFSKVYVCLDKDATVKAVDMERTLSYYADVSAVYLRDDLKYFTPDEVRDLLRVEGVKGI